MRDAITKEEMKSDDYQEANKLFLAIILFIRVHVLKIDTVVDKDGCLGDDDDLGIRW